MKVPNYFLFLSPDAPSLSCLPFPGLAPLSDLPSLGRHAEPRPFSFLGCRPYHWTSRPPITAPSPAPNLSSGPKLRTVLRLPLPHTGINVSGADEHRRRRGRGQGILDFSQQNLVFMELKLVCVPSSSTCSRNSRVELLRDVVKHS